MRTWNAMRGRPVISMRLCAVASGIGGEQIPRQSPPANESSRLGSVRCKYDRNSRPCAHSRRWQELKIAEIWTATYSRSPAQAIWRPRPASGLSSPDAFATAPRVLRKSATSLIRLSPGPHFPLQPPKLVRAFLPHHRVAPLGRHADSNPPEVCASHSTSASVSRRHR